jgi:DNA-binding NtrC family response regulator
MTEFSLEAMHLLTIHGWPGNVRQLEHVIERAVVLSQGPIILAGDLILSCSQSSCFQESFQKAKAKEIARFEKNYLQGLLSACKGNITKAAGVAQKNRRAFWQLIQKHQIDVSRFRSAISKELTHS